MSDPIVDKMRELAERPDVVGVTIREIDRALLADGITVDPLSYSDVLGPTSLLVESLKDADGKALKRDGFIIWTPVEAPAHV